MRCHSFTVTRASAAMSAAKLSSSLLRPSLEPSGIHLSLEPSLSPPIPIQTTTLPRPDALFDLSDGVHENPLRRTIWGLEAAADVELLVVWNHHPNLAPPLPPALV